MGVISKFCKKKEQEIDIPLIFWSSEHHMVYVQDGELLISFDPLTYNSSNPMSLSEFMFKSDKAVAEYQLYMELTSRSKEMSKAARIILIGVTFFCLYILTYLL